MVNNHDISELLKWYQRITNNAGANVNMHANIINNNFEHAQTLAAHLNLLRSCYSKAGSISLIRPSTEQPNLLYLHQSISSSSNSIFSTQYLCHHTVRKFYTNFSLDDVHTISRNNTSRVTLVELLIVLRRMLNSQRRNIEYPDIHGNDLPYRSRSWVLGQIKFLESVFIGRECVSEEYTNGDMIVEEILDVLDELEVLIESQHNMMREIHE